MYPKNPSPYVCVWHWQQMGLASSCSSFCFLLSQHPRWLKMDLVGKGGKMARELNPRHWNGKSPHIRRPRTQLFSRVLRKREQGLPSYRSFNLSLFFLARRERCVSTRVEKKMKKARRRSELTLHAHLSEPSIHFRQGYSVEYALFAFLFSSSLPRRQPNEFYISIHLATHQSLVSNLHPPRGFDYESNFAEISEKVFFPLLVATLLMNNDNCRVTRLRSPRCLIKQPKKTETLCINFCSYYCTAVCPSNELFTPIRLDLHLLCFFFFFLLFTSIMWRHWGWAVPYFYIHFFVLVAHYFGWKGKHSGGMSSKRSSNRQPRAVCVCVCNEEGKLFSINCLESFSMKWTKTPRACLLLLCLVISTGALVS